MPFVDVEIRVPKCSRRLKNGAVWFTEKSRAVVTKPQPVVLNQLKHFTVVASVYAANDHKLLLMRHQLLNVLPEQREWRVGDDDIGLLEQVDAFLTAEVAVLFERERV